MGGDGGATKRMVSVCVCHTNQKFTKQHQMTPEIFLTIFKLGIRLGTQPDRGLSCIVECVS